MTTVAKTGNYWPKRIAGYLVDLDRCNLTCSCNDPHVAGAPMIYKGSYPNGNSFTMGIYTMHCCGKLGRLGIALFRAKSGHEKGIAPTQVDAAIGEAIHKLAKLKAVDYAALEKKVAFSKKLKNWPKVEPWIPNPGGYGGAKNTKDVTNLGW